MTTAINTFSEAQMKKLPDIRPGDTIRVHQKIKDGDKERIQVFEGLVLARKHGKGINATITVRKVSQKVGVERIFPIHSPMIDKIEVVKRAKIRRAKLYYLREAKGKKARLKTKEMGVEIPEEEPAQETVSKEEPTPETTEEQSKDKEKLVEQEEIKAEQAPEQKEAPKETKE